MKRLVSICVAVAQLVGVGYGAATGTDMFDAIRAGDGEKVKALLQADPKLAEARTEDTSTALHLAALEGQAEIARLLLTHQARPGGGSSDSPPARCGPRSRCRRRWWPGTHAPASA